MFASFALLRHQKFGDSMKEENSKNLEEIKGNSQTNPKVIEDAEKNFEENEKNFTESTPSCVEQVVFNAVFPAIHKQIEDNIEKSFNKENEEMYPKEKKDKKSKK